MFHVYGAAIAATSLNFDKITAGRNLSEIWFLLSAQPCELEAPANCTAEPRSPHTRAHSAYRRKGRARLCWNLARCPSAAQRRHVSWARPTACKHVWNLSYLRVRDFSEGNIRIKLCARDSSGRLRTYNTDASAGFTFGWGRATPQEWV